MAYNSSKTIDLYPEKANLFLLTVDPPPKELFSIKRPLRGKEREEVYFEDLSGSEPVEVTVKSIKRALSQSFLNSQRRLL